MSTRKFLIAGNWKMNLSRAKAVELAQGLVKHFPAGSPAQVALIPTFVHLEAVGAIIKGSTMKLGAQDAYFEKPGAFTGEVSCEQLAELAVQYVLVGHSERRHILHEADSLLNKKLLGVLAGNMTAVLCVGETLDQRKGNQTQQVVQTQLQHGLAGVPTSAVEQGRLVVAYEPVWAIGTGLTATPEQAQEVHQFIRERLAGQFGHGLAQSVQIQYGGSVKKASAHSLLSQADIDGLLVGGASLIVEEFAGIIAAAATAKSA